MWDGLNRRRFPRLKRRCEIYVYPASESAPIITFTDNIGIGGISVSLTQELVRLAPCRLKLELDKKIPNIDCDARVVWVVKTKDAKGKRNRFDTGIEFVNLESELFEKVKVYIDNLLSKEKKEKVR